MKTRGFGSGVDGFSQTSVTIIIVFLAISLYNFIELNCIIWWTFKRHAGLYFWSFVVATWGIPLYCAGFLTKYLGSPSLGYFSCTLIVIGWICLVTGQSMVLWSRVHLVLRDRKLLKMILWMIITNAIVCHGAIIPMVYGSFSSSPEIWRKPYTIMEKIEVTVFFFQEVILSGFYIARTGHGEHRSSRRLKKHLILVNVLIILLDITILGLEYANQYEYQTAYKCFVYSTKLKLEFTILNRLVEMTTGNKDIRSGSRSRNNITLSKTSIAPKTLIDEADGEPTGGVSYLAYARGGGEGSNDRVQMSSTQDDNRVMMTTEIIVHRAERRDDETSICRMSSADSTIGVAKAFHGKTMSKASSEIDLATHGF
ncbi:hypothetical protein B0T10DRAFT_533028 [Thelonectria olida]|uniref:DUF7703 domain-containing protein n=1 Tax=Thelonectria olida TaxID=1576542 RepID=A0A9P8VTC0_9HYPO|nr:hypothetical protein B0T10DRAFT_533028 [Thelonectria olida]